MNDSIICLGWPKWGSCVQLRLELSLCAIREKGKWGGGITCTTDRSGDNQLFVWLSVIGLHAKLKSITAVALENTKAKDEVSKADL